MSCNIVLILYNKRLVEKIALALSTGCWWLVNETAFISFHPAYCLRCYCFSSGKGKSWQIYFHNKNQYGCHRGWSFPVLYFQSQIREDEFIQFSVLHLLQWCLVSKKDTVISIDCSVSEGKCLISCFSFNNSSVYLSYDIFMRNILKWIITSIILSQEIHIFSVVEKAVANIY